MKTEATTDRRDDVALFRYGLIADLTHMEPGEPGTYARLKEKASHRYAIPGSHRTEVAAETMRGWLRAWRKGGFDALRPKPRADQGQARAIPQEVTEALNRRLWAFIEGEYHHRPHKGLGGETPLDRWAQACDEVRLPEPGLDLAELFLFEEKRKVARDRTVSLRGALYEVDAILVGQTVALRFDPTRPERKVEVWHVGRKVGAAKPVDAYANCFVKRDHATKSLSPSRAPEAPPEGLRLRDFDGDKSKGGR